VKKQHLHSKVPDDNRLVPYIQGGNSDALMPGALLKFREMTLHERSYHTILGLHPMAHTASQRCLKLTSSHARRLYHSSGPPCPTVAKLLNSSPSDENVTVNGFIRSIRNQKARSFAVIGDGTSLEPLQALLTPVQAQRYVFFSRPEFVAQFYL
jgi:hypothetical protein